MITALTAFVSGLAEQVLQEIVVDLVFGKYKARTRKDVEREILRLLEHQNELIEKHLIRAHRDDPVNSDDIVRAVIGEFVAIASDPRSPLILLQPNQVALRQTSPPTSTTDGDTDNEDRELRWRFQQLSLVIADRRLKAGITDAKPLLPLAPNSQTSNLPSQPNEVTENEWQRRFAELPTRIARRRLGK
jgi:hypothetical protein